MSTNGATPSRLWLEVHGLTYRTQASVRVNDGNWIDLRNDTPELSMSTRAANMGGIGGPNFTIRLTIDLPASGPGSAVAGTANTVNFRFNGTDGSAMGFRILDLDFMDANDNMLVAGGQVTQENPNSWGLPAGYTSQSDINTGENLWKQRNLLEDSPLSQGALIVASCSDCHAQDGLDLKYFNYSNRSIIERSKFHGLNDNQANRIAAYIRSRNYPNPGRPWNPPYQPGPGLDAKPIDEWAAGAGIDAVLDEDSDVAAYMPDATDGDAWRKGNHIKPLAIHDIPLAIQLIDWNRWLPKIHPLDMPNQYDFLNDPMYTTYTTLRTNLEADRDGYVMGPNFRGDLGSFGSQINSTAGSAFKMDLNPTPNLPDEDQETVDNVYSASVWTAVKLFEIMHEFDLIKVPRLMWGYNARDRQWFSNRHIFNVSPHRQRILKGDNIAPAVGDGDGRQNNLYLSNAWYELQRQLNSSARSVVTNGFGTLDWAYVDGVMKEQANATGDERDAFWRLNWMRSSLEQGDAGYTPYGGAHNYKAHSATNLQDHSTYFLRFINSNGERDEGSAWGDLSVTEENSYLIPAFQVWLESFARFSQSDWVQAVDPNLNEGRYSMGAPDNYFDPTSNKRYNWKSGGSNAGKFMRMADALSRDGDSEDDVITINSNSAPSAIINAILSMGKTFWPGPAATPNPWDDRMVSRNNGPAAPSGLNAIAQNAKVKLTWNSVSGADSYNVKRRESNGEEWWTIKFFVDGTEFIDEDLLENKTYQYKISSNGPQYEGPDSNSASASPNAGLVAHWTFDESNGNPIESESPSGMRDGVIIESADISIPGTVNQNVAGISGKGIQFNDYGHVSIPVALNFALGRTGSVSAWMKTDNGATDVPSILGAIGSFSENEMRWGYVDSTGNIAFDFSDTVLTGPQVNDGNWHHVAMTRDETSGTIELYVDGVLEASGTDATGNFERARVFRIDGSTIDELQVYNKVLSSGEVASLATPPSGGGSGGTEQSYEAEGLNSSGSTAIPTISHSNASGGQLTQAKAGGIGDWIEFTISVNDAGEYDVVIGVRKRFNAAIWQLSIDGTNIGSPVDLYTTGQDWVDIDFGTANLSAGNHTLRFEVTGKNPDSSNHHGYFDTISIVPTGNGGNGGGGTPNPLPTGLSKITSAAYPSLAIDTNGSSNGSNVLLTTYTGADSQIWDVQDTWSTGYTNFINSDHSKYLENYNTNANIYDTSEKDWKKFTLIDNGDGTYTIQCLHTGLVLTAEGATDGSNVGAAVANGASNQRWIIASPTTTTVVIPSGLNKIVSVANPALFMDTAGLSNGSSVILKADDGEVSQVWDVQDTWNTGYTNFINTEHSKYLENYVDDANIYDSSQKDWKKFTLIDYGDGSFGLLCLHTGLVLTAEGTTHGSNVGAATDTGADTQKWIFVPVN